jgi:hypothetical protein
METVEIEVFEFDELDDEAKEKARDWYRDGLEYFWFDDAMQSIRAFVSHFGGDVIDWEVGGYRGNDHIKTNITPEHFRGKKLKDIDPEYMPTGYCVDCSLWHTFHKEWKNTGDPMYAFQQALEAALSDIRADIEYQYTDEAVDDAITVNDYRFTKNGKVWR